jgi:hypothetical protein
MSEKGRRMSEIIVRMIEIIGRMNVQQDMRIGYEYRNE